MGKIYPQKRKGQVVGYSVYVGVSPEGRRERRFFTKLEAAENFVRVQTIDPRPTAELFDRKAELLYALEQLRHLRVTLPEVVAFYVRHHKTLSEIALCLTRRGIPTRTGKTVWFGSTVKTVVG